MHNFEFVNPTKVIFGKKTILRLGDEVSKYGKKVLLCTGGGSIKQTGLYDKVMLQLKEHSLEVFELAGIQPNPKLSSVQQGVEICKRENIDLVLAVGGGSTIDAAKAIAAGAKYNGDVWDFFENKATIKDALPLCSVLTLPATGTEMNGFSSVSKWDTKEKLVIWSQFVFPKASILDPELTFSLPKEQTVNGIVDIITHVTERYFSFPSDTPLQDRFGEGIIRTVIENAYRVLENPNDYNARANIMWCGTMANNHLVEMGKEFDGASHSIEHEVSAIYDIAHGAGLAIIFPNWMKYVIEEGMQKFKQYSLRVWDVDPIGKTDKQIALEGIERTRNFFNDIGAPATLKDLNIDDENFSLMAQQAVRFGPIGNYKKLDKNDVENILKMC